MASRSIMAVAAAVFLGMGTMADAAVKTFQGGTGVWNTGTNWSPIGVPTGADRAVIPANLSCTIDINATADTIDVDGTLIISAGNSLTLENNNDNVAGAPDNSVVDGEVRLAGNSGSNALLSITTTSHAFSGTGMIKGSNVDGDKIEIGVNLKLTNQLATAGKGIRGSMRIIGLTSGGQTNGALHNGGLIQAGDSNVAHLILASTTILDDIAGAIWSVDSCKGDLQFDRAATTLRGDLFVGPLSGRFKILADVFTCGTYTRNGGGLLFQGGATFQYESFATGTITCGGNPGEMLSDALCGNGGWTVYADVVSCVACPD